MNRETATGAKTMRYPKADAIVWQFDTANLRIVCHVEPEDMDPADSFEFPEDIEAVRSGAVEWFCAFVSVWWKDDEGDCHYLAHDCLGGCAYSSVREFITSHRDPDPLNRNSSIMRATCGQDMSICHYFPDMVAEATRQARDELRRVRAIPVREPSNI